MVEDTIQDDINRITQQLEQLQLQRESLEQEERTLLAELRTLGGEEPGPEREPQQQQRPNPQDDGCLRRGDTVYITNRLGAAHAFGRRARETDRAAIVTGVSTNPNHIYLTTFNGYRMWRLPDNIRIINAEEAARIREQEQR